MAETTIEWTRSPYGDGTKFHPGFTFNPWMGCEKISPACDHCYAERDNTRHGRPELWAGTRRRTSDDYWKKPLSWNRKAQELGVPLKVFCASWADVFEVPADPALAKTMDSWRLDLFKLIASTPNLVWLLLTKRPQHALRWVELFPFSNVWLGTTVEDQERADERIPYLVQAKGQRESQPGQAPLITFVSCEPLLGPLDLAGPLGLAIDYGGPELDRHGSPVDLPGSMVDWVIGGGESGHQARPSHPDWARQLRDQCSQADVPFLWKQWGDLLPDCQVVAPEQRVRSVQLPSPHSHDKLNTYHRPGKKEAGRLLDGRTHDGMPEARLPGRQGSLL